MHLGSFNRLPRFAALQHGIAEIGIADLLGVTEPIGAAIAVGHWTVLVICGFAGQAERLDGLVKRQIEFRKDLALGLEV